MDSNEIFDQLKDVFPDLDPTVLDHYASLQDMSGEAVMDTVANTFVANLRDALDSIVACADITLGLLGFASVGDANEAVELRRDSILGIADGQMQLMISLVESLPDPFCLDEELLADFQRLWDEARALLLRSFETKRLLTEEVARGQIS